MELLVDIGNTSIKWACHDGQRLGPQETMRHGGSLPGELVRRWGQYPVPGRVLIANVCGALWERRMSAWMRKRWGLVPEYPQAESVRLGVVNAYRIPAQLGVDRWLGMLAVHTRFRRAALIVDCGTAVTLDAIDNTGRHRGGLICPGLTMMQDSLLAGTGISRLRPLLSDAWLAADTAAAIGAGGNQALIGLIERIQRLLAEKEHTEPLLVMSGTDSARIYTHLGAKTLYEPDLVLQGLKLLL